MSPQQQYEAHVVGLQAQANAYAQHYGLDPRGAHNGAWDAFRHAYVSAELTRIYNSFTARVLGDMHEFKGTYNGQPLREMNMDLWNNAAGRDMGSRSTSAGDSARRVKNALDNNSLITRPEDNRSHNSQQPPPDDKDPEVCCADCGADMPPPPPPPEPGDGTEATIPPFLPADPQPPGIAPEQVYDSLDSLDSTVALIAEMRFDAPHLTSVQIVEIEHAIELLASVQRDHHEQEIAVI